MVVKYAGNNLGKVKNLIADALAVPISLSQNGSSKIYNKGKSRQEIHIL
jgi:hypothetical protein